MVSQIERMAVCTYVLFLCMGACTDTPVTTGNTFNPVVPSEFPPEDYYKILESLVIMKEKRAD